MTGIVDLLACNIIERDSNGDVLWTWTYPSLTDAHQQQLMIRKCGLDGDHVSPQPFVFGRYGKNWYYINCTEVFESDNLPRLKQFALILWAKDLNPEKYETLCRILSKTYCKTGNPAVMLQLYLSVITRGSCTTEENGTFLAKDFESRKNIPHTTLKELIQTFGLESILIYTGLLLKKRIIVYHHSLEALLKWIRTFPAMMWHRKSNDILHPWVDNTPEEILDLKSNTYYIAGCKDSAVCSRLDLFDLLVNLPAREITVAPHAKESMAMTKTHKDIAVFMVQLADQPNITEAQMIRELAEKTRDLLQNLRSLATVTTPDGKMMVSVETLREKNFPQALDNFLFNLAVAENMMLL
ncbi:putative DENN domain-containing protein 10 B isoform X1 [Schistocerca gregaria]|uniref:putative DENN domain-containing protein 10 B isoform X1 n=1 Tax=Schistocerca gregaria TaxID=7010 RepID=UPI00211E5C6F|nr:putative DENN domain-containing protein 10 B isoform X1 [Schistocerca gregaria]